MRMMAAQLRHNARTTISPDYAAKFERAAAELEKQAEEAERRRNEPPRRLDS
jgi:hypothetical protein